MNEKVQFGLKLLGMILIALFLLIGLSLPFILFAFYSYAKVFNIELILFIVITGFIVGVVGLVLFIKQIRLILEKKRAKESFNEVKTHILNKLVPIIMLGLIFGVYVSIYPQWYYNLGVDPRFGPYIAYNGETGMQISWDTRTATQSLVEYGISPDNLNMTAWGGEFYWQGAEKPVSKHHCVLLENLLPNTRYYYRVPSLGSNIYSFISRPPSGVSNTVLFTILGDTQGALNIQRQNIAQMKQTTGGFGFWNFTIIAGDLVNRDDDIAEWAMVFDSKSYGGIASSIPWLAVSGNHEASSSDSNHSPQSNFKRYFQNAFASNWENPDGNWDIGTYYSFNYSNIHIAMVDTLENRNHSITDRQLIWLSADLANAKNAGLWTFVVFHSSMYSTSSHGPYPELADKIEPLMKTHRIDAIFWGHDHIFEAYHAFSNESYGGTYCFMVAGGGGSPKKVEQPSTMGARVWTGEKNEYGNYINNVSAAPDNRFANLRGSQWQLYGEKTFHYMQVKIEGDVGYFVAFRTADGSVIQNYTITKK